MSRYYRTFLEENVVTPSYPASLKLFIDAGNPLSYSGSGTTVTDLTSNGNNCTLINGVNWLSSNGGIFSSNGINQKINTPIYSTVTEMSAMLWINCSSFNSSTAFFLVDVGQGYIEFKINTTGKVIFTNYLSTDAIGLTSLSINNWYSIGFSFKSGVKSKVYVNGVSDGLSSGNASNIGNNSALLSMLTNGASYTTSKIGSVKIFNAQMSDADHLTYFNEFKSRYGY